MFIKILISSAMNNALSILQVTAFHNKAFFPYISCTNEWKKEIGNAKNCHVFI